MGFTYPAVAGAMQNDQRAFSAMLASLQGTASNFAAHCIQDSRVREQYLRDIQKMSAEFVRAVCMFHHRGKINAPYRSRAG